MLALAGTAVALEALYLPAFTPAGAAAGVVATVPALLVSAVHYQRTSGHVLNPLPVLLVRPASAGSGLSWVDEKTVSSSGLWECWVSGQA